MDRLVKVDATEIQLQFRPSERCTATFKITSLIHTMSVAVQLTTTSPSIYSFYPTAVALIPPLSTAVFTLLLRPLPAPPLASPSDSLLVTCALAPALRRANSSALLRFFSRPAVPLFRDASLPIHLLGPHILRSLLLLPDSSSLQNSLLLSRVIPSCSPSELSTALPLAAASGGSGGAVSALLSAGADPNARHADGKSAISLAVSAGSAESAEELVLAGAADRPFHEAAAGNRTDLILLLLTASGYKSGWADVVDPEGRTPVHAAAGAGSIAALRLCLATGGGDPDRADMRGWMPLHYAAAGGHLGAAELLVGSSAFDPRLALTREKKTPLDLAVERKHAKLYGLLRPEGVVIHAARAACSNVAAAIRAAGGAGERDQNGWTALHVAAFKGRTDAVKELVEGGAEVEAVDDAGYTPLRCAVEAGRAEVALLLVAYGARAGLKGLVRAKGGSFRVGGATAAAAAPPLWETCAAAVSAAVCEDDTLWRKKGIGIENGAFGFRLEKV
ncbi:Potassium channel AKT6 [Apostasia shenzhenica]|uniref:Potassium channel AKT6 n=1 Tax=Apostasia shenzhenica TaxID=1088818 RepID=A0A2H9ZZ80_9ASPA|nr:Potassium channel AKT6 [Apostasia shenzhenica]